MQITFFSKQLRDFIIQAKIHPRFKLYSQQTHEFIRIIFIWTIHLSSILHMNAYSHPQSMMQKFQIFCFEKWSVYDDAFISNFECQMNVTRQTLLTFFIIYLFIYQPTEMIGIRLFERKQYDFILRNPPMNLNELMW